MNNFSSVTTNKCPLLKAFLPLTELKNPESGGVSEQNVAVFM
jgi:hypothetical protein